MSDDRRGPVLIDLEEEARSAPPPDPARAPAVPDPGVPVQGAAMQRAAELAARRASPLARLFWGALAGLLTIVVTTALWDFAMGLLARNAVLGWIVTFLAAVLGLALLGLILRETAAWFRLGRLDGLHRAGAAAAASGDLGAARDVTARLVRFYADRVELERGRQRLAERQGDQFDADALLGLAERELLAPLDRAARREIEAAARQVATVTALVPLALADVFTALAANLRMIRRIAEIYGGRAGTFGSWRLTRTVLTHLVATGAVAVGDDMIQSIAGGGLVSRLSRRFGEGVVNGALTARVGVAAMEVCRPLPFAAEPRPSVTGLVKRALAGLFGGAGDGKDS
jgi:putative membrane protein